MSSTTTTKPPVRGDKVIDNNQVLKKHGTIVSGVWDASSLYVEVMEDCWVRFSHNYHVWYTADQLKDHWSEEQKAYILD